VCIDPESNISQSATLYFALACPELKSLGISALCRQVSLIGLNGALAFRKLEILHIEQVNATREDLLNLLTGREKLRELNISQVQHFVDPAVFAALPHSIESLSLLVLQYRAKSTIEECLRLLGGLPNLKKLDMHCQSTCGKFDWLVLLPAALRLHECSFLAADASDESFCAMIGNLSNLKNLDIKAATGNWDGMLKSISGLASLENFELFSMLPHERQSIRSLQLLVNGPVRSSLLNCTIYIFKLASQDEELRTYALRFFNEEVRPFFDNLRDSTFQLLLQ